MSAGESGWHLKREVSIGHILTTIVVALSTAAWLAKMEARIAVLETHQSINAAQFGEIKAALVRIEQKLDRKADRPLRLED